MRGFVVISFLLAGAVSIKLTSENFDKETAGKSLFVSFQAPWCGHCKMMKPYWDRLMMMYEGNEDKLVAVVDCAASGKSLCDAHAIKAFPSIKYGAPDAGYLEDYVGAREYSDFKLFLDTKLGVQCGPASVYLCNAQAKTRIKSLMELSEAVVAGQIADAYAELQRIEDDFKEKASELLEQRSVALKKKHDVVEAIEDKGLTLMKVVQAYKTGSRAPPSRCSAPFRLDDCDAAHLSQVDAFMRLTEDELSTEVVSKSSAIWNLEGEFQDFSAALQANYESVMETKNAEVERMRHTEIPLLKSVQAYKKKTAEKKTASGKSEL